MPARVILLTGGSGFVGRHLRATLAETHPHAEIYDDPFDIADAAATEAAVLAVQPDACVHLAAVSAIADARRDPDHAWRVNLHGTLTLARAVLRHAPRCLFLFTSSADAYGASFRSGLPADEATPLAPLNTYAATKAAADLALGALAAEGLHAIRLRAFNHSGAGQTEAFALPAFARHRVAHGH